MQTTPRQISKWTEEFYALQRKKMGGIGGDSYQEMGAFKSELEAYIAGCEARFSELSRVISWLDTFRVHAVGLSKYVRIPHYKKTLPPDLVTDIQDQYSFQCMVEACLYGKGASANLTFIDEPESMDLTSEGFTKAFDSSLWDNRKIQQPNEPICGCRNGSDSCFVHGVRAKK